MCATCSTPSRSGYRTSARSTTVFAMRAGTKPEGDWTEAKSTHEVPDELMKEIEFGIRKRYNTIDVEVVK